jgi:NAD(P)-dependent dehydrogenase (short-subunit alcohol dehydrogenase family)
MSSRIAAIFGAGPGLGAALAESLGSSTHNVLLLSRSLPGSLPKLGLQIPDAESRVLACPSDGSPDSLKAALEQARSKWPKGKFDVGISNAGPKYSVGGFLDQKEELARQNLEVFM